MKKLILVLLATVVSFNFGSAQEANNEKTKNNQTAVYSEDGKFVGYMSNKKVLNFPKHIFGIRAGALLTKMREEILFSDYDETTKYCVGAHLGGTYEIALSKTHRWFFQTGLELQFLQTKLIQMDGYDYTGESGFLDNTTYKTKSLYLEIPAMFSCKFQLGKHCGIYPSLGFSYMAGLRGKTDKTIFENSGHYGYTVTERHEHYNAFSREYDNHDSKLSRHVINAKAELNFTVYKALIGVGAFYPLDGEQWGLSFNLGYNF